MHGISESGANFTDVTIGSTHEACMCRELTLKEFKKFRVFRASVVNNRL